MHKALPPRRIAPSEQTTDETDHIDPKRQTEKQPIPDSITIEPKRTRTKKKASSLSRSNPTRSKHN